MRKFAKKVVRLLNSRREAILCFFYCRISIMQRSLKNKMVGVSAVSKKVCAWTNFLGIEASDREHLEFLFVRFCPFAKRNIFSGVRDVSLCGLEEPSQSPNSRPTIEGPGKIVEKDEAKVNKRKFSCRQVVKVHCVFERIGRESSDSVPF